jgi:hypothetical protein
VNSYLFQNFLEAVFETINEQEIEYNSAKPVSLTKEKLILIQQDCLSSVNRTIPMLCNAVLSCVNLYYALEVIDI